MVEVELVASEEQDQGYKCHFRTSKGHLFAGPKESVHGLLVVQFQDLAMNSRPMSEILS